MNFELKKFKCTGPRPITVYHTDLTNGGGTSFGQDYIPTIKRIYPGQKFGKIFEWCAGPGFIGFSLLSHNLCDKLCLNDYYIPAVNLTYRTIRDPDNNCKDEVTSYCTGDISLLPSHEMFDLVVSNPPHQPMLLNDNEGYVIGAANSNRITTDLNWETHKNFFKNIKSHLNPNGIILLMENKNTSSPSDFEQFIEDGGLEITNYYEGPGVENQNNHSFYYLEIKSKT